jgi:Asp-tRNA(Asn)/Glu-tRNA(Gln) amidotransferase A subunit family amidase
MNYEAARALAWEYATQPDLLSAYLRKTVARYRDVPYQQYADAIGLARACRSRFSDIMADFDVMLTPSAPGEAPLGLVETGNSIFNRNWTLLGVPCVTVPAGTGPAGLPLGVQVVGDYANDHRVLACAEWVRQAIE